jgi:N utilization substance protein B
LAALDIAEFTTLDSKNEVKDYAVKIAEVFQKNHKEIDDTIQKYAKNWDIDTYWLKWTKIFYVLRFQNLLFIKDAPMKVVVDEAIELAKKYSTDDSASFINGILAKVIVDFGLK